MFVKLRYLSNLRRRLSANFSGFMREGATVETCCFNGANLQGAILRNANLKDADLGGVNLSYADLSGAILTGANLENANLTGAVFHSSAGERQVSVAFQGAEEECSRASVVESEPGTFWCS